MRRREGRSEKEGQRRGDGEKEAHKRNVTEGRTERITTGRKAERNTENERQ